MGKVTAPVYKLNYKIVGRRTVDGDSFGMEYVDVEWTHDDGPVTDKVTVPVTHPPAIEYEIRDAGQREVIHDQVTVKPGTPDSIVMQMLEEKRERLAKNLGVEP